MVFDKQTTALWSMSRHYSSTVAPQKRRNGVNNGPLTLQQNMPGKRQIVALATAWKHGYLYILSVSKDKRALLLPQKIGEIDGSGTLRERYSRIENSRSRLLPWQQHIPERQRNTLLHRYIGGGSYQHLLTLTITLYLGDLAAVSYTHLTLPTKA